jgi:signal recognition particle subunit SRP68
LQSIDSIKELRGAVRDAGFIAELDGQRAYFQALKCLNLSHAHAFLSAPKQALTLSNRALSLSSQAVAAPKSPSSTSGDAPKLAVTEQQAEELKKTVENLTSHYHGLVALSQLSGNPDVTAKAQMGNVAPVVERLNEYPVSGTVDLKNLVTWPPKLKPVPVKPLFFDVAFNYIDYPGRARVSAESEGEKTEVDERKTEGQKPAKKGWFGFGR